MKLLKTYTIRTLAILLPAQCPFEREVTLFGKHLFTIPKLCQLNPFYEEIVAEQLRLKGYD